MVSGLFVLACAPNSPSPVQNKTPEVFDVVDIAAILKNKKLPEKQRAEQLTRAGEKLVSPIGFMYADRVFAQALEIDPRNKKALFYKAFLNPLMQLKGILKRMEPLVEKSSAKDQKRYHAEVQALAPGGLREFLLDGPADIDSEVQLQSWIQSVRSAQNRLRLFLQASKELILTLKVNLSESGITRHCSVVEVRPGVYQSSPCDFISVQERKVDRADIEVFQHLVAGLQVYSILLTAYEGTGLLEIHRRRHKGAITDEEMVRHLLSVESFGRLRDGQALSQIPRLGADIFAGVKWAYRMQAFLCPLGRKGGRINRHGYLVHRGICVSKATSYGMTTEKVFHMIEIALQGLPQTYEFRNHQKRDSRPIVSARFNPLAPVLKPQTSLKKLLPRQFDSCGRTLGFADPTLGGAFPDGDSGKVLQAYRRVWSGHSSCTKSYRTDKRR